MNTDEFLSIKEDYDVETYTLKQVMELLDIKQKAVYNLASRGHIKALDFPYGKRIVYHYTRESVDQFLRDKQNFITISELADEFNLSKNVVFSCLQKNNISYELNEIHFPRRTAVITVSQVEQIRELLKNLVNDKQPNTARKSDFYRNGYGLYQPFIDPNGSVVRLVMDENTQSDWGFYSNNFFLPLTQALKEGYQPQYEILDFPAIRSPYAVFTAASYDKTNKVLIDLAYQQLGFRNMYIEQADKEIRIHLKEAILELSEYGRASLTEEWIQHASKDGFSVIQNGCLEIKSGIQIASYYLKSHVSNWIDEYAKTYELQPGEVIELAMRGLIQGNNQSKGGN